MPDFMIKYNPVMIGWHIFRDKKEVTFIPCDELMEMYEKGVISPDSDDINKNLVTVLRSMKNIKLHPSQYKIERMSA